MAKGRKRAKPRHKKPWLKMEICRVPLSAEQALLSRCSVVALKSLQDIGFDYQCSVADCGSGDAGSVVSS